MCGGRVDPSFVIEAFAGGADGVFVGTCLEGECHYSTGNLEAKVKMDLTSRVLARSGVDPARLALRMMSSAEGAKFASYIAEFVATIDGLGPLHGDGEGGLLPLGVRLEAARMAVEGKKLRWIAGKATTFEADGNLYGEFFTQHELGRLFEEVVSDEYARYLILLIMQDGSKEGISAIDLAKMLERRPAVVLRHLVELKRLGLVDVGDIRGTTPVWYALPERVGGECSAG